MSFLIRAAFWLSLVILILPSEQTNDADHQSLSTAEAYLAAQATLSDFTGFCARQPGVCAAGEVAIETFSAKARYGAKRLYEYLDGASQGDDVAESSHLANPSDQVATADTMVQDQQALTQLVRDLQ